MPRRVEDAPGWRFEFDASRLPVEYLAFKTLARRKREPSVYVRMRSEGDYHSERLRVLAAYTEKVFFFGEWADEACARFKTEQGM